MRVRGRANKAKANVQKYLNKCVERMLDDDFTRQCFVLQTKIEDEVQLQNKIVLLLLHDIAEKIEEDIKSNMNNR